MTPHSGSKGCNGSPNRSITWGPKVRSADRAMSGRSQKYAEIFVEEHIGIEDDRAPRHLPFTVHLQQHIVAAAAQKLRIRIEMRELHQECGLGPNLPAVEQRRYQVADQVTGARRRVFGPRHAGVEPRDA